MVVILAVIVLAIFFIGTILEMGMDGIFGFGDIVMIPLCGLLFGAMAGGAVLFGGAGVANLALDHHDRYQRVELVAIRDMPGVEGAFVLGTGTVGSSGNYMFYYRDGRAIRLVNVDGSSVNLYQDSKDAYAIRFTGCELSPAWVAPCFSNESHWDEIHVPPGTVKTKIDLGLSK